MPRQSRGRVSQVSEESKKTPDDGRSMPGAADPAADLLGEFAARSVGQRGPGKRSAEFVAKVANAYGMLPGDLLAATLMGGLREYLQAGNPPEGFLAMRARKVAGDLGLKRSEALGMLVGVAKELMPYVHQRQPLAVDADVRAIVFAAVTADGRAAPAVGGRRDLRPADVREKPAITGEGDAASYAARRTPEPTALKEQGE